MVQGTRVAVTQNLAYALRLITSHWHQRYASRSEDQRRFWVDALCFNQGDFEERGMQVQLMRDIYSSAELVLSSIATDEVICQALQVYQDVHDVLTSNTHPLSLNDISSHEWLRQLPSLFLRDSDFEEHGNKSWHALGELRKLPYWSRVWIIQEAVLAREVILFCGHASLPMKKIFEVYDVLQIGESGDSPIANPEFMQNGVWCKHCYSS
jgi:hypothetical protein